MTVPPNQIPPEEQPADHVEYYDVDRYPGGQRETHVVEDRGLEQRTEASRLASIVGLLFGILEGLIIIRIILRLLGANPGSPFASFIYGVTDPFLWPFQGLFGTPGVGDMVLEISTIVGLIVYALIGYILTRLVYVALYRPTSRTVRRIDRDDY